MKDNQDIDALDAKIKAFEEENPEFKRPEPKPPEPKSGGRAGAEFGLTIVFMIVAGVYLDIQFDTRPVLVLVFLFLGIAVAFYNIYRFSLGADARVGFSQLQNQENSAKQHPKDKNS